MSASYEPEITMARESRLAYVKILVMGNSGSGKTTFLATASNALILQVEDQGIHSVRAMNPEAPVIHIDGKEPDPDNPGRRRPIRNAKGNPIHPWDHLSMVFRWIQKSLQARTFPYSTVCLDSFHDAQGLLEKKLIGGERDKIRLSRDEYGLLGSRSLMLLETIKRTPCHFIVVTKSDEFQDGDELKVRPGGVGRQAPSEMAYRFNVVAYAYKRIPEDGGRPEYLLLTDGHDKFVTKGHPTLHPVEVQNADSWIQRILEGGTIGVLSPAEVAEQEGKMPQAPKPPPPKPAGKKKPGKRGGKQKGDQS